MKIYEHNPYIKEIIIDGNFKIKTTEIREKVDGVILNSIARKLSQINYDRFKKCKEEVNTIVMNPHLYRYIEYLLIQNPKQVFECFTMDKLFGLKIVVRDDYQIDEIDFYRDVTEEMVF